MKNAIPSQSALKQFFLKDKLIHELEAHRRWVERFMFMLGLVSAAMAVPQMVSIYTHKDSSQVSLMAWGFYAFAAFLWIVYASTFNRPVVKRVQVLYFVSNILVVAMILMFR